jgi:hypothetical protein
MSRSPSALELSTSLGNGFEVGQSKGNVGEQAARLFAEARQLGGLVATAKLASMVRITSAEAASMADTPESIRKLEEGLAKLRIEEDARRKYALEGSIVPAASSVEQMRTLRRHLTTFAELLSQRALLANDVNSTLRRIDEMACTTLEIERVSVWFLDAKSTKLSCADLYESGKRKHSSGTDLFAKDFGPYFEALAHERTIAAHNAHTDPRTSCFSESYLQPLGIASLLDVPIWVLGKMVGVICHEHVGRPRRWDGDEENFAYLMSNFVALALERAGKIPGR